jgi:hypothetical protein
MTFVCHLEMCIYVKVFRTAKWLNTRFGHFFQIRVFQNAHLEMRIKNAHFFKKIRIGVVCSFSRANVI